MAGVALVLGRAGRGASDLDTGAALSPSAANPAQDALSWAHDSGVLPALPDGSFAPDAVVTRGDLALALHRFAGAPTPNLAGVPTPVADAPEDPERAAAVLWLHGRGALWGDAELRVRPDEPATQETGRGIVSALLAPALTGAGIDATTVLEAALTTGEGTTKGGTVDAAPLTRAVLATTLHSVDQALTS
ncbi:S-layer homology domain-containing protein [Brachybacterium muris]|uniref:S-layer homology domain-containing protein n=1 Tax=Brachybacterium muris TaxID=219301 RepID=UPI00223BDFFB|nr:S-layer homology domain-containing protein [Brachybacterium muris]